MMRSLFITSLKKRHLKLMKFSLDQAVNYLGHFLNKKNPPNVTPNDVTNCTPNVSVKYDVISHLKKILAMLSMYDALCLSSDLRNAFITALSFPEDYRAEVSQAEVKLPQTQGITFNDEDLLLGNKRHNIPLLMFGEIDDLPINRIMIDGGSAINLLPLRTLKKIGYSKGDLLLVFLSISRRNPEAHGYTIVALHLEVFRVSYFPKRMDVEVSWLVHLTKIRRITWVVRFS
jgi:hypothetical protein